jgi:hypothetical protein
MDERPEANEVQTIGGCRVEIREDALIIFGRRYLGWVVAALLFLFLVMWVGIGSTLQFKLAVGVLAPSPSVTASHRLGEMAIFLVSAIFWTVVSIKLGLFLVFNFYGKEKVTFAANRLLIERKLWRWESRKNRPIETVKGLRVTHLINLIFQTNYCLGFEGRFAPVCFLGGIGEDEGREILSFVTDKFPAWKSASS